jgi:hypothetical protein
MAAVSSPYGCQIISDLSGTPRAIRLPLGIANQYNSNIFKYQPVKLLPYTGTAGVGGTLQAVTNPGGTPDSLYGIFAGVEYTPLGGRPAVSPFWPAGTNYNVNENMFAYYWPLWMPGTRLLVQADGSVPATLLGASFNFTNLAAGNTSVGFSLCTVGAAGVAAGSQGQLTLVEFAPLNGDPDAGGDAFTDLICTVAYPQVGFKGQNSLG